MTPSYPIHLHLAGRSVLVAGAGRVATRKIERLLASGARVSVVAPHASARVMELAQADKLVLAQRPWAAEDVEHKFLVLAATDDAKVNARIAAAGRAAGALVTRVDDASQGASDFSIPAVAREGVVEVTVSTGGAAPSASRRLGRELARWLARGPARFAAEVAALRVSLRGRTGAPTRLKELAEGLLFDACLAGDDARIAAITSAAREEQP